MDEADIRLFQERFRAWLESDPEAGAWIAAQLLGYSLGYVRWAADLAGHLREWWWVVRHPDLLDGPPPQVEVGDA